MSDGLQTQTLASQKGSKDKKITVINDTCLVNNGSTEDYKQSPYVSYRIESTNHAVAASLHIMLKHMADMHSLILEVMSEKYNIPYDDMVDALHKDARIQNMVVQPTVHALNYFSQEDLDKTKDNTAARAVESLSAAVEGISLGQAEPTEPTEPKKTRRILKKPTIIQSNPAPTEPAEPTTVSDSPKKKIIRKKPVAAPAAEQ